LLFQGRMLMENPNGLLMGVSVTRATGKAEREAAGEMIQARAGPCPLTVGVDRAYDTYEFVAAVRALGWSLTLAAAAYNHAAHGQLDG